MLNTTNETVAESSYRRIRADIIFGRLAPAQKLKLESLKETYETSVSTLREILNRLSSEGLVVAEGQRGFEVSPVSATDLREIAALRLLLETHALEQSFEYGDVEWEARLVSAHYKLSRMERVMATGDTGQAEDWKRYDWEFHQALISACGSKLLMEMHSVVFDKYLRYQMVALSYRGEIAAKEHQQLLDAALRRDQQMAKQVLTVHIEDGVEHALARNALR
ncbi:DNA-binding GntR family transcriptional regulator [Rhizobium sp. BK226]|uniref:GntR family transcriptional regulator n=1 Tax=Rhizobium anhuiense TaxID=1184720 RepID=A0A432N8X7_9HYPH|nr:MULTISPECIES: GntR family transcriptional regulator [Rhizobium]KZS54820.1 GntR family transcriptional regulator [Rhizobium anhuiense bv. trifolii]MBB3302997.1 DNA-binding GntR family transcriptional regulator [Rhizobium sp. BK112]MBB3371954.1 DNA-binding GntR family transcriptional regulator [Rhizobium sp. BK077]MBB3747358.1 DNA-binding GntR family transcriptional regulator [Rhizobium sp. BK591]MBB4117448.1 DNA-binding GntR family transcriptional regulator [Rhizobium sp. BK226]